MRALLITLAMATFVTGCIGGESGEPPVVGIRNMYNQPRYDTQERQPFFADQRSMRPRGRGHHLSGDDEGVHSLTQRGGLASDRAKLMIDSRFTRAVHRSAFGTPAGHDEQRGEDRYDIYCAPVSLGFR